MTVRAVILVLLVNADEQDIDDFVAFARVGQFYNLFALVGVNLADFGVRLRVGSAVASGSTYHEPALCSAGEGTASIFAEVLSAVDGKNTGMTSSPQHITAQSKTARTQIQFFLRLAFLQ